MSPLFRGIRDRGRDKGVVVVMVVDRSMVYGLQSTIYMQVSKLASKREEKRKRVRKGTEQRKADPHTLP